MPDSLDERVFRDLHLSLYNSADEIFKILKNRFGNQAIVTLEIIEALQTTPQIRSGNPRKI